MAQLRRYPAECLILLLLEAQNLGDLATVEDHLARAQEELKRRSLRSRLRSLGEVELRLPDYKAHGLPSALLRVAPWLQRKSKVKAGPQEQKPQTGSVPGHPRRSRW